MGMASPESPGYAGSQFFLLHFKKSFRILADLAGYSGDGVTTAHP
jgi:hypothetical protein